METIYDEELPVLERIKLPMVWARLGCGVRVEDLQAQRYEDALQIAREHFVVEDPCCKGCNLTMDPDSVEEFLGLVQLWMGDTQSFLAVEDATNRAVGVLVGRVIDRDGQTKTMSRTRIYNGKILAMMQRFQSHIHKQVDIFKLYNTKGYYKVCLWCVVPEFREQGIGTTLLRVAIEQTVQFRLAAVMGVFTGAVSQRIANSVGFDSLSEILYWQWKEGGDPVFDNPGPGNSSANLMVAPAAEPDPEPEPETADEELTEAASQEPQLSLQSKLQCVGREDHF